MEETARALLVISFVRLDEEKRFCVSCKKSCNFVFRCCVETRVVQGRACVKLLPAREVSRGFAKAKVHLTLLAPHINFQIAYHTMPTRSRSNGLNAFPHFHLI